MAQLGGHQIVDTPRGRKFVGVMTAVAALGAIVLSSASPADAAQQDCRAPHCYAVESQASGQLATGTVVEEHANSFTPGNQSISPSAQSPTTPFITSETWLNDSDTTSCGFSWVEAGLVNGYNFSLGYWAYAGFTYSFSAFSCTASGWQYFTYTAPDGRNHSFQVSRSGTTNHFNAWMDGTSTQPISSIDVGFWSGYAQVGGECYCAASNEHSDSFDIYHRYVTTSGAIVAWPITGNSYALHPGFNAYDGQNFWRWNLP